EIDVLDLAAVDFKAEDEIIGQDRAVQAMEFGLRIKNPNYHIFIAGPKGTGKKSYARKIVEKNAEMENVPDDWCYVNNFDDPSRPIVLNLPPGLGEVLCEDMEELIEDLLIEIPKIFNGEEYEKEKTVLVQKFYEEKNKALEYLHRYSKENGFIIRSTDAGFAFLPLNNGEIISDKEYDELDEERRMEIDQRMEDVQIKVSEVLKKIKALERETRKKLQEIDDFFGRLAIEPFFDNLYSKYRNYEKVIKYLKDVQKDVMKNLHDFRIKEDEKQGILFQRIKKESFKKYKVNVLVSNKDLKGAPVIVEWNPSYGNLIGKIEYENEQGTLKTDFTMIRAGAVHRANGGYLILQAEHLLRNISSWEALKRILQTKEICIESLRPQPGILDIVSLKPEAIPVQLKVILIGSPDLYQLLYQYDEDFASMFKIKVDFDFEMEANRENAEKTIGFIHSFCNREAIKPLNKGALFRMLLYSHRIAGSKRKLTTRFSKLSEILIEANVWAEMEGSEQITEEHIRKAYLKKQYRNNQLEEKIREMYKAGRILFETKGKRIGRIHGLSILADGEHVFGKPSVITATTFMGSKGVVNIEREVDLSGSIHDKGVMILEGYMNEKFAQEHPLNFTAKICFEQSYGGVDGDSASCAELYALLSSLSGIPLKQNIAVTGSINQKGEVQPVGGINEKIEGFFHFCEYCHGLQDQGVIIPEQNIEDLVLCDSVIKAVEAKKFHIYPISKIDEGMEILTEKTFEQVCQAVREKLSRYAAAEKLIENYQNPDTDSEKK
ncbi:MAG TPA: AAA family ATPase, partial [Clostridiales bacterium]|nr:AAA family ATPase [Clostridiales bacterium]